jgi:predicted HTH transcriptional regulator
MTTSEDFSQILALGHERRGVEFKGPRPSTDKHFLARVARAALGMSNLRDGGMIIVGVDEVSAKLVPKGLNGADLSTWKYDDVSVRLAEYADPYVTFDLEHVEHEGADFVIIRVQEFDDVPVLCKKPYSTDGKEVLRAGACYVRSTRKPETSEIPSQAEMREVLDLALVKRLRSYISVAERAGVQVGVLPEAAAVDRLSFEGELGDLK